MGRETLLTVIGTSLIVGALAVWGFVAPAEGSGWILFIAFIGAINLLDSIRDSLHATISGVTIAAAASFIWFTNQGVEHDGWVGLLAILATLAGLDALDALNTCFRRNR